MFEFKHEAGIYNLTWYDYNIGVRIDRLRDTAAVVTCELSIKGITPGNPRHYHQARLNLVSTSARETLARHLEKRYMSPPPWGDMLEQACVLVLRAHREGEPPVRLGDLPKREALQWRVRPILVEKQANMIYGAGQSGKSMIAVYIAVLVDSPLDHNGLYVEPGNVLYIDYETDETEVAERVRAIQTGIGVETPTNIIYRFGRAPLADDIEQVQRIVAEDKINLVIVDSLGMAAGGDLDKATDFIRYFQAMRTLKCTSLTIDHLNKEGKLYGNVYKFNESRCIWEAKAVAHPGQAELDIGLYHRKMNNGMLQAPLGFRVSFTEGVYTFTKQEIQGIPDLEKEMPLKLRIYHLLRDGAVPVSEISEALEVTTGSIRTTLNRHKELFIPVHIDGSREPSWGLKVV